MKLYHGTCIIVAGAGILLRGPSGSGKSDLAFRMIEAGKALLVSDDQTEIRRIDQRLIARVPGRLAGLIEVRGLGVLSRPHQTSCTLDLVIDLVARDDVPRMPQVETTILNGIELPRYSLCAFDASTPAKLVVLAGQLRRRHRSAAPIHV